MTVERRQVHRREPIETELDNGEVFVASPLPWMDRNDLGDAIVREGMDAFNEGINLWMDPKTKAPQIEMIFREKIKVPLPILRMMYPGVEDAKYQGLVKEELVALMLASTEVNGLQHLNYLIDPNLSTPTLKLGGTPSSETPGVETTGGPKIESLPDSPSPDSLDQKS